MILQPKEGQWVHSTECSRTFFRLLLVQEPFGLPKVVGASVYKDEFQQPDTEPVTAIRPGCFHLLAPHVGRNCTQQVDHINNTCSHSQLLSKRSLCGTKHMLRAPGALNLELPGICRENPEHITTY